MILTSNDDLGPAMPPQADKPDQHLATELCLVPISVPTSTTTSTTTTARPRGRPRPRRIRKPLKPEERVVNQQRCKAFRQKRKQYEDDLEAAVRALHDQVAELTARRAFESERAVHLRNALSGSLVRMAREMKRMLRHGVGTHLPNEIANVEFATQYEFFRKAMAPEAQGNCGNVLHVMRLFESCYEAPMFVDCGSAVVSGTEDDPMVTLRSLVYVRLGEVTFRLMFPHVVQEHPEIAKKLLHRTVVYDTQSIFRFTPDGRIWCYDVNMDVAGGLLQALENVEETVALLSPSVRRCLSGANGTSSSRLIHGELLAAAAKIQREAGNQPKVFDADEDAEPMTEGEEGASPSPSGWPEREAPPKEGQPQLRKVMIDSGNSNPAPTGVVRPARNTVEFLLS